MLIDIERIIINESNPIFYLSSEDENWKKFIESLIIELSDTYKKKVNILHHTYHKDKYKDYMNYESVLDMFSLSRCKEILQGVKYSTFSILASLIGGNSKIRNYSFELPNNDMNLTHLWSSIIDINNNEIQYNKEQNMHVLQYTSPIDLSIFM